MIESTFMSLMFFFFLLNVKFAICLGDKIERSFGYKNELTFL